eukprot:UN24336
MVAPMAIAKSHLVTHKLLHITCPSPLQTISFHWMLLKTFSDSNLIQTKTTEREKVVPEWITPLHVPMAEVIKSYFFNMASIRLESKRRQK